MKDKNEAKRLDDDDDDDDDDSSDTTSTDSETNTTKAVLQRVPSENREVTKKRLVSPPPPTPPPDDSDEIATVEDNCTAENELSHLRARCRRLEQSLQQLVNTELWARNRQIGKLEQHRYVTQPKANAMPLHEERRLASAAVAHRTPSPAAKGILVVKSTETARAASKEVEVEQETKKVEVVVSAAAAAAKVVTPPPVLPDYSEVNFFFSCDEEDEQEDSETNTSSSPTSSSSSSSSVAAAANETECSDDDDEGQLESSKPVRLAQDAVVPDNEGVRRPVAVFGGAPSRFATSTPTARPRKRQYSHRHATAVNVPAMSSSSSSEAMSLTGDLNGGVTTTTSPTRRRQRTASGCTGMHWRRRCKSRPRSKCSTCGRSGPVDGRDSPATCAVQIDAQVQCGDGGIENPMRVDCGDDDDDDDDQLQVLRRELDARRRENGCLYGMLLRHQSKSPSPVLDVDVSSPPPDRCDSPESYRLAARNVRGRIADLLPPLLSMQRSGPVAAEDNDIRQPVRDDNGRIDVDDRRCLANADAVAEQQQQQQLQLLARLRERIVAYERQELQLNGNQSAAAAENSIYDMDRSDLVNVALPRAVDRLRRALVPLLEQQQQRTGSELEPAEETTAADNDRLLRTER